ncbi:MAG: CBS domain-containing protein [bacterium]
MTRSVKTLHLGQNISDTRKLLAENNIHHIPVVS